MNIFSNCALLSNVKDVDKPIYIYSSGGATHCITSGTLNNIVEVYLHKNGLANILSYAKVKDKHNITNYDVRTFSLFIHPINGSISKGAK